MSFLFLHLPYRGLPHFKIEVNGFPVVGVEGSLGNTCGKHPIQIPPPRAIPVHARVANRGIPGALQPPHPHQYTLWPTTLRAQFDMTASYSDIEKLVADTTQQQWGVTIPVRPGFRRVFGAVPDDFCGYPRILGCNDPSEYSTDIPILFAWPGWIDLAGGPSKIWSSIIFPTLFSPTTPEEAAILAKHLEQMMTSLGNLWILKNTAQKESLAHLPHHERPDYYRLAILVLSNLAALVECAGGTILKCKRSKLKDRMNQLNTQLFDGSLSDWMKVIRDVFERPGSPLNGFLAANDRELRLLAHTWSNLRNDDAHSPAPLIIGIVDYTNVEKFIGFNEARDIAVEGHAIARKIVEALDAFPLSALTP